MLPSVVDDVALYDRDRLYKLRASLCKGFGSEGLKLFRCKELMNH